MSTEASVVLYAEDSEDDAFLMQRAFNKLKLAASLVVVPNGLEAIRYLDGAGPYSDRKRHPLPRIILLDVQMPHLNGLRVLEWAREQPAFRSVPVYMLTSSSQPSDIDAAYRHGANSYLVKPANLHDFACLVEDLAAECGLGGKSPTGHIRGAIARPQ